MHWEEWGQRKFTDLHSSISIHWSFSLNRKPGKHSHRKLPTVFTHCCWHLSGRNELNCNISFLDEISSKSYVLFRLHSLMSLHNVQSFESISKPFRHEQPMRCCLNSQSWPHPPLLIAQGFELTHDFRSDDKSNPLEQLQVLSSSLSTKPSGHLQMKLREKVPK